MFLALFRKCVYELLHFLGVTYARLCSLQTFDDETRSIRAQTAALLKRIHEPLPRATKIFPISVARYKTTSNTVTGNFNNIRVYRWPMSDITHLLQLPYFQLISFAYNNHNSDCFTHNCFQNKFHNINITFLKKNNIKLIVSVSWFSSLSTSKYQKSTLPQVTATCLKFLLRVSFDHCR